MIYCTYICRTFCVTKNVCAQLCAFIVTRTSPSGSRSPVAMYVPTYISLYPERRFACSMTRSYISMDVE